MVPIRLNSSKSEEFFKRELCRDFSEHCCTKPDTSCLRVDLLDGLSFDSGNIFLSHDSYLWFDVWGFFYLFGAFFVVPYSCFVWFGLGFVWVWLLFFGLGGFVAVSLFVWVVFCLFVLMCVALVLFLP